MTGETAKKLGEQTVGRSHSDAAITACTLGLTPCSQVLGLALCSPFLPNPSRQSLGAEEYVRDASTVLKATRAIEVLNARLHQADHDLPLRFEVQCAGITCCCSDPA